VWQKQKLPVLNPHQQSSLLVTIEFIGEQKLKMNGREQHFKTFKFDGEASAWVLWFNGENKLVRVVIAAENTEVVRD
jgi:hypothetical protein